MDKKTRKVLEECEKFIDESTPEELAEYEDGLNLNYEIYDSILEEVMSIKNGRLLRCDVCGKEEFIRELNYPNKHNTLVHRDYEDTDFVYRRGVKCKLGDLCGDCADTVADEIVKKYKVSKGIAMCHLKHWQTAHVCNSFTHYPHMCPNYEECRKIAENGEYGNAH